MTNFYQRKIEVSLLKFKKKIIDSKLIAAQFLLALIKSCVPKIYMNIETWKKENCHDIHRKYL